MPASATAPFDLKDLESHRRAMLKFAILQLRSESLAEDCVQEALAAAIQSAFEVLERCLQALPRLAAFNRQSEAESASAALGPASKVE